MDDVSGGLEVIKLDSVEDVLQGVDEDQLQPELVIGGGEKLVLVGTDSVGLVEHVVSETASVVSEQEAVQNVSVVVSVSVAVNVSVVVSVSVVVNVSVKASVVENVIMNVETSQLE